MGHVKTVAGKLNAKMPKNKGKIVIYIVIGVVLISIIIAIIVHYHKQKGIKNPVYFHPKPHLATGFLEKPGTAIHINPAPYSFSWHMFIYVPSWDYRYGFEKEVFSKGDEYYACPSVHLGATENNIIIRANTQKGLEKLRVSGVNIRKWFHLAVVVEDLRMESYLDGHLNSTLIMKSVIQTNNDALYICRNEGFKGLIYKLCYTNSVLSPLDIRHLASKTPPTKHLKSVAVQ